MSRRRLAGAVLVALLAGCETDGPIEVGVLLPTSTARGASLLESMRWAAEAVNAGGGIDGRSLALVVEDTSASAPAAAQRLVDRKVHAVLGPETSAAVFAVAGPLLEAELPFVSPSATSGDYFRAFAGTGLAWRTVESDIAQVRTMLAIARRDGAKSVSLLVGQDSYGDTFFNWFGFFAGQLGLERRGIVYYDHAAEPDCAARVDEALAADPDVLLAIPSDTAHAICLRRALAARISRTRVLFSDTGADPALLDALGPLADGMEGTIGIPDPSAGFGAAWRARTGEGAPAYVANAYDALALVAYGLARSHGARGKGLGQAMTEVVDGRGTPTRWDATGIAAALPALARGEPVDVSGAAGPLNFDRGSHTDLVVSSYGRWQIAGGSYSILEHFSSAEGRADSTSSIYESFAPPVADPLSGGDVVGPRTGMSALIVATSRGWENYRHQADALATYGLLRERGLDDERIVLILADDLSGDARSGGQVLHTVGGPDLRAGAIIDYRLDALRAADVWTILRGQASTRLPIVPPLSPSDDLLIYLVGHGSVRGVQWDRDGLLAPVDLADALEAIQGRYRRALVVVDACLAGVMADQIVARRIPRVMVLASTDRDGGSLATAYDATLGTWLADEFTTQLSAQLRALPTGTLLDTYRQLYTGVPGSYVSVYNASRFGALGTIPSVELFGK